MKYTFSYSNTASKYINIEYTINAITQDTIVLSLPLWRPGRYEMGNFAKNIQHFEIKDKKGNKVSYEKITKSTWKVDTKDLDTIVVQYNYYAAILHSGSTYLDDTQMYVNPCNCCLYIEDRLLEPCEITLQVPTTYEVATSLKAVDKYTFIAEDFHELADSPFIASATLQHNSFMINDYTFHLWFQGICKLDWSKLLTDFFIFAEEQITTMKGLHVSEYHFLFQIVPYNHYHGVEHLKNTVITLGPGYELMRGTLYEDLLGVASHEFFHTWNIKKIRPADMFPYQYDKENYSKLGYIYEGLTTYYGDLFLYRSGVFNDFDYFKQIHLTLQKHYDNYGRFHRSVAESSIDNWIDGYNNDIPHRKVSIYTEGSLLCFILDTLIRKNSKEKYCIDDITRSLYANALQNIPYTDKTIQDLAQEYAGISLEFFFKNYVYGYEDYEALLIDAFNYIGCELVKARSRKMPEACLGMKLKEEKSKTIVTICLPNSPAEKAGLGLGDELLAINGIDIKGTFSSWCKYFQESDKSIKVLISTTSGLVKEVELFFEEPIYFPIVYANKLRKPTNEQIQAFYSWSKRSLLLADNMIAGVV